MLKPSSPTPTAERTATVPLCIDLDGTLVKTNTLLECLLALLRHRPAVLFALPFWCFRGLASLWGRLGPASRLNVSLLPYNPAVIDLLRTEAAAGRKLILVTGAHETVARQVAAHLGSFHGVLATTDGIHLVGARKAERLVSEFGVRGFDYVGDSRRDLVVWRQSRQSIVANSSPSLLRQLDKIGHAYRTLPWGRNRWAWLRVLRPHQWIKNVLVFGPVVLGHALGQSDVVIRAGLAFVACCLAGSGTYLVNDLLDVESDREHSSKRARPFAAGDVPLEFGFALAPLFFLAALLVAHTAGSGVAAMLGAYVIASAGYSFWLKRVVAVDVVLLAGLYCLRLLIGAVATGIPLSPWAAAFSMFFFLSVALMKRYAEIFNLQDLQKTTAPGRGYRVPDMQAIMSLGTGSGMTAVLVVALYLSGNEVVRLYRHPQVLWLECVLVLLAITRLWILTSRGEMHEDPVMFAVKDPWTVVLVLFTGLVMILAL